MRREGRDDSSLAFLGSSRHPRFRDSWTGLSWFCSSYSSHYSYSSSSAEKGTGQKREASGRTVWLWKVSGCGTNFMKIIDSYSGHSHIIHSFTHSLLRFL